MLNQDDICKAGRRLCRVVSEEGDMAESGLVPGGEERAAAAYGSDGKTLNLSPVSMGDFTDEEYFWRSAGGA